MPGTYPFTPLALTPLTRGEGTKRSPGTAECEARCLLGLARLGGFAAATAIGLRPEHWLRLAELAR